MSIIKSFLNKIFVSSIVLLMSVTFAYAQVTNIIPFGPGGESDVTARMQQPFYKSMFKDDVVVQYKPGGGGSVGWQSLNSEKADGSVTTRLVVLPTAWLSSSMVFCSDGVR